MGFGRKRMMKDLVLDESMSNLTSTSGEVSASTRIETAGTLYPLQQSFASADQAPAKKKRNLPGNPDPGAEVIALSPKTLLATNRFICEICNKGFQRDQNLQLHRRGHNLPWKLKQRTNKEVRKKVYVCPETTCVHHDPSRALGDLTGIKKHFCRKHGEKKWKCEKCSKPYAVQSDWKAHSKICGTREYRCDCGTLFSRRDSFITHRAFCDALAEESARAITAANPVLLFSQQPGSSISHMTNLQPQLHSHVLHGHALSVKREQDHLFNARVPADSIAPLLACPPGVGAGPGPTSINHSSSPLLLEHRLLEDENPSHNSTSSNTLPPFQTPTASPHMSATALLQKAAQMGVTMSKPLQSPVAMQRPYHHHQAHMSGTSGSTSFAPSTAGSGLGLSAREDLGSGLPHGLSSFGNKAAITSGFMEQVAATNRTAGAGAGAAPNSLFHDMINSLSSPTGFDGSSSFEQSFDGISWNIKGDSINFHQGTTDHFSETTEPQLNRRNNHHKGRGNSNATSNIGGNDGLTRDFLGLKALPHRDFPNLAGLNHRINSSSSAYERQNQQSQTSWQG